MPVLAFLHDHNVKDKVKQSFVRKIDDDDVRTIRELKHAGMSYRQIGYKFDISHEMCRRVCIGQCYSEVL
ncbi:hypothetical protein [Acinetobacter puyangensis]|uniref:hypothetical protein n=1 Tax=Acinetobacter puyangensis TaxID=1096779 RepID=UPI003A4D70F3